MARQTLRLTSSVAPRGEKHTGQRAGRPPARRFPLPRCVVSHTRGMTHFPATVTKRVILVATRRRRLADTAAATLARGCKSPPGVHPTHSAPWSAKRQSPGSSGLSSE